MIDLTADVSATVLAATAAKLEAEQTERDEAEVQKNVAAAVRPFQQKVVCALWAVSVLSCSLFYQHVWKETEALMVQIL